MMSGLELLLAARAMSVAEAGQDVEGARSGHLDEVERAALVAALLSSFTPTDAPLIRELTRKEIAWVDDAGSGCGDVLLACCWLLFMVGRVEDAALIWRAKNVNFDAHCYIDSVFLIPQGAAATAEFARSEGLMDLAEWVAGEWVSDTDAASQGWRSGSFFAKVPPAGTSAQDLAGWLRE